jgi:pyruvate ferredoxin oxidoreductase delta subunit
MAQSATPKWTELAVGTAITVPGSARQNRTGDWRSQRPVWDHEKCIRCGVCVIFCPEGCLGFGHVSPGLPDADLEYCKGCAICAHECPTACISMLEEEE